MLVQILCAIPDYNYIRDKKLNPPPNVNAEKIKRNLLTWLFKKCADQLLPLIAAIIKNPITPLLKRLRLDKEDMNKDRPIFHLLFISKLIEKVVSSKAYRIGLTAQ